MGKSEKSVRKNPKHFPAPPRSYVNTAARQRLAQISSHLLMPSDPIKLVGIIIDAVRMVHHKERSDIDSLKLLLLCAEAGAEDSNLGKLVAYPARKGGRRSRNAVEAIETQNMLQHLSEWIDGGGECIQEDLHRIRQLALRGSRAIRPLDPTVHRGSGRPPEDGFLLAHSVRMVLVGRWYSYQHGRYRLNSAIRQVAIEHVLKCKQEISERCDDDQDDVTLSEVDEYDVHQWQDRIKIYYHRYYPGKRASTVKREELILAAQLQREAYDEKNEDIIFSGQNDFSQRQFYSEADLILKADKDVLRQRQARTTAYFNRVFPESAARVLISIACEHLAQRQQEALELLEMMSQLSRR